MAEKGLGGLLRGTAADLAALLKLEAALAAERAKGAARIAGIGAGAIGAGMTFALFGLLLLLGAAAAGLAIVLPVWASLLIVGGGAVVAGGVMAMAGLFAFRRASKAAAASAGQVKEDLRWVREQTS